MQYIDIHENQIYIRLAVTDSQDLKLLHFSALPLHEEDLVKEAIPEGFPFLSMNLAGFDRPYERHGNKFIVTAPGYRMKYLSHSDERMNLAVFSPSTLKMKRPASPRPPPGSSTMISR